MKSISPWRVQKIKATPTAQKPSAGWRCACHGLLGMAAAMKQEGQPLVPTINGGSCPSCAFSMNPALWGAHSTDHRFTGHPSTLLRNRKADGTGLMYYNTRYYDPEIGQFISPDSIVPDPTNVFDYNRYMYVYGNPLNLVDPSGNEPCRTDPGICIGPGAEEEFILGSVNVRSNDPSLAADVIYDFAEVTDGYQTVHLLLIGNRDEKTVTVIEYRQGRPYSSGKVGEVDTGCAMNSCDPSMSNGVRVYTGDDYNDTKSITLHELAHIIDVRGSRKDCGWFGCGVLYQGYPEDKFSKKPYVSGNGGYIDPHKEYFARGVTSWVYGEGAKAGQSHPLTPEQQTYLDTELRNR